MTAALRPGASRHELARGLVNRIDAILAGGMDANHFEYRGETHSFSELADGTLFVEDVSRVLRDLGATDDVARLCAGDGIVAAAAKSLVDPHVGSRQQADPDKAQADVGMATWLTGASGRKAPVPGADGGTAEHELTNGEWAASLFPHTLVNVVGGISKRRSAAGNPAAAMSNIFRIAQSVKDANPGIPELELSRRAEAVYDDLMTASFGSADPRNPRSGGDQIAFDAVVSSIMDAADGRPGAVSLDDPRVQKSVRDFMAFRDYMYVCGVNIYGDAADAGGRAEMYRSVGEDAVSAVLGEPSGGAGNNRYRAMRGAAAIIQGAFVPYDGFTSALHPINDGRAGGHSTVAGMVGGEAGNGLGFATAAAQRGLTRAVADALRDRSIEDVQKELQDTKSPLYVKAWTEVARELSGGDEPRGVYRPIGKAFVGAFAKKADPRVPIDVDRMLHDYAKENDKIIADLVADGVPDQDPTLVGLRESTEGLRRWLVVNGETSASAKERYTMAVNHVRDAYEVDDYTAQRIVTGEFAHAADAIRDGKMDWDVLLDRILDSGYIYEPDETTGRTWRKFVSQGYRNAWQNDAAFFATQSELRRAYGLQQDQDRRKTVCGLSNDQSDVWNSKGGMLCGWQAVVIALIVGSFVGSFVGIAFLAKYKRNL